MRTTPVPEGALSVGSRSRPDRRRRSGQPSSICAPDRTVHALVCQRVYGLALGYEDLNDHGALRSDSALALLVGKHDLVGARRERARDRGHPLAGPSTLNRLELGRPEAAAADRYKRIAADPAALD